MGFFSEKYDSIKESVSEAWNSIFSGNGNFLDFKPPQGYCSPDEVSARLPPGTQPEAEREVRKQIAQDCAKERQAELKESDDRKRKQAEADAKKLSNTEGRITYCEGLKKVDKIYCDNVSRNYDIKQLELIAYILKKYEPSDLRDKAIEAVKNVKSPVLLYSVSLKFKVGEFDKELKSNSRIGKPSEASDKDHAVPGASIDAGTEIKAGPLSAGIRITGGVSVPITENDTVKKINNAKKTITDTQKEFEEQAKQEFIEKMEKQRKELNELMDALKNK